MKAPSFWSQPIGAPALVLAPLGVIYGLVTAARMRLMPGKRVDVPVLCVGNFTLGGSGKTPTVIALIDLLRSRGERPFVLSRGHGGTVAGPHLVDLKRDTAAQVGDEAMLLAVHAPVVVGADRAAGAEHARRFGASVLLMDDGLQNPSLTKDLRMAVIDGTAGFGNGLVFPAGPLRAQISLQRGAVDAVLVVGAGGAGTRIADQMRLRRLPVITARLVPSTASRALAGMKALAFCGIGAPRKFRHTLEEIGVIVKDFVTFPDHHVYTRTEAEHLVRRAAASGLAMLTTRKDHVRLLASADTHGLLAGTVNVVDVQLVFDEPSILDELIGRTLQRFRNSR